MVFIVIVVMSKNNLGKIKLNTPYYKIAHDIYHFRLNKGTPLQNLNIASISKMASDLLSLRFFPRLIFKFKCQNLFNDRQSNVAVCVFSIQEHF